MKTTQRDLIAFNQIILIHFMPAKTNFSKPKVLIVDTILFLQIVIK